MENPKQMLSKSVRATGMVVGFTVFVLFVYKASHDVSNARIAAGAERRRAHAAARHQKTPPVSITTSNYTNGINALPMKPEATPNSVAQAPADVPITVKLADHGVEHKNLAKPTKQADTSEVKHEPKDSN